MSIRIAVFLTGAAQRSWVSSARAVRNCAMRRRLAAGSPAVDIALADKIATLRHALLTDTPVRRRKLSHYRATLQLARDDGIAEPLCARVEELLDQVDRPTLASGSAPPAL